MTFTLADFTNFTRCPALYELTHIHDVPMPPTTRQVLSRVVRDVVLQQLQHKVDKGVIPDHIEVRKLVTASTDVHMGQDIAYTADEAARGQRTAWEKVFTRSMALVQMWRSAVAPRIEPAAVLLPFVRQFGDVRVAGNVEIDEPNNIRVVRVRQRRPAADAAMHDLPLLLQAGGRTVIIDYLIDAEPLVVDRQVVEHDEAKALAVSERVRQMARACEAKLFVPADPAYWRCQSCGVRVCCRYV